MDFHAMGAAPRGLAAPSTKVGALGVIEDEAGVTQGLAAEGAEFRPADDVEARKLGHGLIVEALGLGPRIDMLHLAGEQASGVRIGFGGSRWRGKGLFGI
jgi:hypothetical protein